MLMHTVLTHLGAHMHDEIQFQMHQSWVQHQLQAHTGHPTSTRA